MSVRVSCRDVYSIEVREATAKLMNCILTIKTGLNGDAVGVGEQTTISILVIRLFNNSCGTG